jgi:hypothetical protein
LLVQLTQLPDELFPYIPVGQFTTQLLSFKKVVGTQLVQKEELVHVKQLFIQDTHLQLEELEYVVFGHVVVQFVLYK